MSEELTALANELGSISAGCSIERDRETVIRAASALHRLAAAGEQKPCGWQSRINGGCWSFIGWEPTQAELQETPECFRAVYTAAVQGEHVATYNHCPTCNLGWQLFPPTKINNTNAVQCVECKAVYPTATPPAPGWDAAIEAVCNVCRAAIDGKNSTSHMAAAEEIREQIEALRHNAPPDSGAGKSAPAVASSLPDNGESDRAVTHDSAGAGDVLPDHGGADAGGGVRALEYYKREWVRQIQNEIWDDDLAVKIVELAEINGLFDLVKFALSNPAAADSNASAEARLRFELTRAKGRLTWAANAEPGVRMPEGRALVLSWADEIEEALSPGPNASDCEKQGETTKSEGSTEGRTCKGNASSGHSVFGKVAEPQTEAGIKPGPSDRPADVTAILAEIVKQADAVYADERNALQDRRAIRRFADRYRLESTDADDGWAGRALLDAFTVGRR